MLQSEGAKICNATFVVWNVAVILLVSLCEHDLINVLPSHTQAPSDPELVSPENLTRPLCHHVSKCCKTNLSGGRGGAFAARESLSFLLLAGVNRG